MHSINKFMRKGINRKNIARLKNKDFSLIASNCNGTFMCHELGLEYKSPFVNLWITAGDYIKLLSDLHNYLNTELKFIKEESITYPVGLLKDIKIHFQHYKSEDDAREKWNRRLKRIDYNNLFILFAERDGCTYEDLISFDKLPYQNKIVFTHKFYPEIESAFYIKGFEELEGVGVCFAYRDRFSGRRKYDAFDYVRWFNSGILSKEAL